MASGIRQSAWPRKNVMLRRYRYLAASDRVAGEPPPTGVTGYRMDSTELRQAAAHRHSCSLGEYEPRIASPAIQSCDRDESAPISKASSPARGAKHHGFKEHRRGFGWL